MTRSRHLAVVRDPPIERRMSMDRYADEVAGRVGTTGEWTVTQLSVDARDRNGPGSFLSGQFDRLVRLPVGVSRWDADLFHIIDQGYAHAAALLPKTQTIITCHDLMLLLSEEGGVGFTGRPTSRIRFRWSVSYLRKVAHVVCVSRTTEKDVHRLIGVEPRRTSVIPNGLDEHFRPPTAQEVADVRSKWRLPDKRTILQVSTGHPYKNVEGVLRTLKCLVDRGEDVALVRLGRPLSDEQNAYMKQLGLDHRVHELGRIPEADLAAMYGAVDVLLHPSFHEGFGWPPLEAMACGTPVVASDIPVLKETLDGAALLAPPELADELADNVQALLNSSSLHSEYSDRGAERARDYTWQRSISELLGVYDHVLASA